MPEKQLHVELIAHTPIPEQVAALAAKLCYAKADVAALRERVSEQDQSAFLDRIMQSGHLSVLEHASFTFAIEGVSRVLLAQLMSRLPKRSRTSFRRLSKTLARKQWKSTRLRWNRCKHGMLSGSRHSDQRGRAVTKMRDLFCQMLVKQGCCSQ